MASDCTALGQWLMKVYNVGAAELNALPPFTMPNFNAIPFVGEVYLKTINFNGVTSNSPKYYPSDTRYLQDAITFQKAFPAIPVGGFAATVQGRYVVKYAGQYAFNVAAEAAFEMYINGKIYMSSYSGLYNDDGGGTKTYRPVSFGAGRRYFNFFISTFSCIKVLCVTGMEEQAPNRSHFGGGHV